MRSVITIEIRQIIKEKTNGKEEKNNKTHLPYITLKEKK